jgi:hypothetical protein
MAQAKKILGFALEYLKMTHVPRTKTHQISANAFQGRAAQKLGSSLAAKSGRVLLAMIG